jgi:hypothetical protein
MSSGSRKAKRDARYANFFQVGYNEFEFLLEFGQGEGRIHTSIYLSPQHAKMLSDLLATALKEYSQHQSPDLGPQSRLQ